MRRAPITLLLFAIFLALIPTRHSLLAKSFEQNHNGNIYTIKPGDYLSRIALEQLGDANAWPQIVDATNVKAQVDSTFVVISDPSLLRAGQQLWLPIPVIDLPQPATALAEPSQPQRVPLHVPLSQAEPSQTESLVPQTLDGKRFGYVDSAGEYTIAPEYVIARRFSEGLAVVSKDGVSFGYINTLGEMVIPAQFSDAGAFSEGLAAVRADVAPEDKITVYDYESSVEKQIDPSGYINRSGSFEIAATHAYAEPFSDGIAIVWDGERNRSYLNRVDGTIWNTTPITPTMPTIWSTAFRTRLSASAAQDATCENSSFFGGHPAIWRCQVEQKQFDPCFVQETIETVESCEAVDADTTFCERKPAPSPIICGYPQNPFIAARTNRVTDTSQLAIEDVRIPNYWITLENNVDCALTTQDFLPEQSKPVYSCSDGSYIIDDLWEVGSQGVWMARSIQLSGDAPDYEIVELSVVLVDIIWDFSTSLNDEGGAGNMIPPPFAGAYWQY